MDTVKRRDFLKGSSTAAATIAAFSAIPAKAAIPLPAVASQTLPRTSGYLLKAKPFNEVTLDDKFWKPVIERNARVTVPFEIAKLDDLAAELNGGVLEAAIYASARGDNPELKALVEEQVAFLIAQDNAGNEHRFFELGAALYDATGDKRLIDSKLPFAAALLEKLRKEKPAFPGGERHALSCLHLFRVTGNPDHLELARYYIDVRGRADSPGKSRHTQSHLPAHQQREAVGHAVNCVTLVLSLLEYGIASGHRDYCDAAFAMWNDIVQRKMYVTGGVGSTGNEGFAEPYDLPNISAYSETCAVLMWQKLNQRLFEATGDARYIDVMERGMYNNMLSGIGRDGQHFFYVNRLASAGDGRDTRWQHAALECCPPNLVRTLARMPETIFAQDAEGAVHVNLYVASRASFAMPGGLLGLTVASKMPWSGENTITIAAQKAMPAALRLRIPGWALDRAVPGDLYRFLDKASPVIIALNGAPVAVAPDSLGYVTLKRSWANGDRIDITFPMQPRRIAAHPAVLADRGRTAVSRGPLVYCAEGSDVSGAKALDLVVATDAPLVAAANHADFADTVVLHTSGRRAGTPDSEKVSLRLIPYFLWANRQPAEMTTWLLSEDYRIGDIGPAGGWIFYHNRDAKRDGWRYLEAAPFDQSLGAKWGCFRQEVPGARAMAIGAGKQNTADILATCTQPASAAQLCASLTVNGIGEWFLPSRDELSEMYVALKSRDIGNFLSAGMSDNCEYWASSQHDADMAAHIDFADSGRIHGDDKDFPRRVRAIRSF